MLSHHAGAGADLDFEMWVQQQIKPRECRLWRTWERKEVAPVQPRFGSRIETSCMCQTLPSGSLNKARER